ncbi:Transcriptional regulatory protein DegU [Pelotomaculum schinkii]|uniref:Stage 0 sporulation protein A homolog n=1 Tax=Pelotomaculum schinkii TaxID=78350 RepID=A0A4Y7R9T7_9FIRM|nr:response regulator [Pelotomaculum schinkii]TEB05410.1 Transcriptional regulatory protein DegU [Pelotomaculum schinkii]
MLKVLVVDDYPMEGEAINYILKKYRPEIKYLGQAFTGNSGLEITREKNPDIVFVDIKMPGMDGLSMTRKLKEISPKTKIVIVTAYDEFEFIQTALRLGVNDYLLKPVQSQELLNVLDLLSAQLNEEESIPVKPYLTVIPPKYQVLMMQIQAGDTQKSCKLLNEIWLELISAAKEDVILTRTSSIDLANSVLQLCGENNCCKEAITSVYYSFIKKVSTAQSVNSTENFLKEFVENCTNSFNQYIHEAGYRQISRSKELIEQRLHTNITLESIAKEIFISPYYLSHLFKKKTGVTFMHYVIERRLEKAKQLLVTTNDTIELIALKTGYEESNSFRRLFKKIVGISPSEYRTSSKKQLEEKE